MVKRRSKEEVAALHEKIIALSCLLMTNIQIGERCGCSDAYVSLVLKRHNIPSFLRRGETSGPPVNRTIFSHMFSGGRFKQAQGYVMVHCPGHPRADRNGHVLEHILVAEMKMKRHIAVGEIVHHINGKRDDNTQDNLMVLSSISEHMKLHRGHGGRFGKAEGE